MYIFIPHASWSIANAWMHDSGSTVSMWVLRGGPKNELQPHENAVHAIAGGGRAHGADDKGEGSDRTTCHGIAVHRATIRFQITAEHRATMRFQITAVRDTALAAIRCSPELRRTAAHDASWWPQRPARMDS